MQQQHTKRKPQGDNKPAAAKKMMPKFEKATYEEFKEMVLAKYQIGELELDLTAEQKASFEAEPDILIGEWYDKITIPTRATIGSAGYDFVTPIPVIIRNKPSRVPTGIKCKMPYNTFIQLSPRSSLFGSATKMTLVDGTIDADYYANKATHGIIFIQILSLVPNAELKFAASERIAQGKILAYLRAENEIEAPVTGKRTGGFGSTGTTAIKGGFNKGGERKPFNNKGGFVKKSFPKK